MLSARCIIPIAFRLLSFATSGFRELRARSLFLKLCVSILVIEETKLGFDLLCASQLTFYFNVLISIIGRLH